MGTHLAHRSSLLAMLAYVRGCVWSVENPKNSELIQTYSMQFLILFFQCLERRGFQGAGVTQYSLNLRDFGADTLKPLWVYSSEGIEDALSAAAPFCSLPRPANPIALQTLVRI